MFQVRRSIFRHTECAATRILFRSRTASLKLTGRSLGSILYTKVKPLAEDGSACDRLSFSPIAVHPDFQRRGIGRALIETTFEKAHKMGHQRIVIFGHPSNDVGRAFVSCKKMNACLANVCSPSKPAYTHYPVLGKPPQYTIKPI